MRPNLDVTTQPERTTLAGFFFSTLTSHIGPGVLSSPPAARALHMARSRAAARAAVPFEHVDGVRVARGGKHGYQHVRGGQGRKKDKYQGVSPKKSHLTGLFDSPQEAAVAYARMVSTRVSARQEGSTAVSRKPLMDFGAAAHRLQLASQAPIGPIACALLSSQQAAAAVARGVLVAYAEELCQRA